MKKLICGVMAGVATFTLAIWAALEHYPEPQK